MVDPLDEFGYHPVDMSGWVGVLSALQGTPSTVITKIASEVNRFIKLPEVSQKILELDLERVDRAY